MEKQWTMWRCAKRAFLRAITPVTQQIWLCTCDATTRWPRHRKTRSKSKFKPPSLTCWINDVLFYYLLSKYDVQMDKSSQVITVTIKWRMTVLSYRQYPGNGDMAVFQSGDRFNINIVHHHSVPYNQITTKFCTWPVDLTDLSYSD